MSETELRHVIALLLEDTKRLQQLKPNAGTEARIWLARRLLTSDDEKEMCGDEAVPKQQQEGRAYSSSSVLK